MNLNDERKEEWVDLHSPSHLMDYNGLPPLSLYTHYHHPISSIHATVHFCEMRVCSLLILIFLLLPSIEGRQLPVRLSIIFVIPGAFNSYLKNLLRAGKFMRDTSLVFEGNSIYCCLDDFLLQERHHPPTEKEGRSIKGEKWLEVSSNNNHI